MALLRGVEDFVSLTLFGGFAVVAALVPIPTRGAAKCDSLREHNVFLGFTDWPWGDCSLGSGMMIGCCCRCAWHVYFRWPCGYIYFFVMRVFFTG